MSWWPVAASGETASWRSVASMLRWCRCLRRHAAADGYLQQRLRARLRLRAAATLPLSWKPPADWEDAAVTQQSRWFTHHRGGRVGPANAPARSDGGDDDGGQHAASLDPDERVLTGTGQLLGAASARESSVSTRRCGEARQSFAGPRRAYFFDISISVCACIAACMHAWLWPHRRRIGGRAPCHHRRSEGCVF
jgi:hypothetical protein